MKRTLVLAGLGIAVLLGGSLIIVALLTGPRVPASREAPIAAAPQPAPGAPEAGAPGIRRGGGRVYPLGAAPAGTTRTVPVRDPSLPPLADRVTGKAVRKALRVTSIQSRLARCVDRDRETGFGGGASPAPAPRGKPVVLLLDLETLAGKVKIVDARVQSWGGASQGAVSCARDVLRGEVVPAARAKPGKHMEMAFTLNPRSPALAATR